MTLDLGAQLEAAQTDYLDNADYRSSGSVEKANAFEAACRKLLMLVPMATKQAGRFEISFDTKSLAAELNRVVAWQAGQTATGGSAGSVRGFSLENCRD